MWTRWWTSALLIAAFIVAVSGCGDSEPNGPIAEPTATATPAPAATPTTTPSPTPTATPSRPSETLTPSRRAPEPDALLESSTSAMEAAGSFHFEIEMVITADSEGISMEVPFRSRVTFRPRTVPRAVWSSASCSLRSRRSSFRSATRDIALIRSPESG